MANSPDDATFMLCYFTNYWATLREEISPYSLRPLLIIFWYGFLATIVKTSKVVPPFSSINRLPTESGVSFRALDLRQSELWISRFISWHPPSRISRQVPSAAKSSLGYCMDNQPPSSHGSNSSILKAKEEEEVISMQRCYCPLPSLSQQFQIIGVRKEDGTKSYVRRPLILPE